MTIYFMGGELDAFIPSDSTVTEVTGTTLTGNAAFNPNFARCAVWVDKSASYAETPAITAHATSYLHCDIIMRTNSGASAWTDRIIRYDGSGTARIKVQAKMSDATVRVVYDVGAGFVQAGSTVSVPLASLQTMDLEAITNTASGSINLYIGGTLRIESGTIDLSAITSLGKARFTGYDVSGVGLGSQFSQVIISDEPTIGKRLGTCYMSGAGANTAWTGTYIDVDEAVVDDADFLNTSTANAVETMTQTAIPSFSGYNVLAVGVSARAKRGASGPQNLQLALRSGGTDYFSASKALSLGYSVYQNIWETNPATSAAWVNTAVSSLQPGVKAIT